ncbi:acidic mammalian chitinase-like [Diorhabda sublineata]|uniref:acidic mammalian chitinase-like n=1 Tax=Diorhabda sublineata TaxID=1163346 RepID=UPI0024E0F4D4|nr:acidic mammalian chitinase-like [Diorhabda sublineata]
MKSLSILSLFAIIIGISFPIVSGKNIICYFASWTVYRTSYGKFDVSNIDPSLCTHFNFAFIGLNEDASIHILDSWESDAQGGYEGFKHLVALKEQNPDLKICVSMGGWNEGSKTYSKVAADPEKRATLAQNVLKFIKEWGFDGFDLDWEYPTRRGGNDIDKDDLTELLKELHNVLHPEGYLLSIAAAGGYDKIIPGYDIPAINEVVDMINVMVFDFHGAFEYDVGHLSPLYAADVDRLYYDNITYNVDFGIQTWLNLGSVPEKINLGIVFYSRTFTLADNRNTSLYAPIKGPGKAGPYTNQEGYLGYHEICEFHLNSSTYVWDEEQLVPHIYWDDQWAGFEDPRSLTEKVKYAIDNDLGGVMIWSLDYDDFRGRCGKKYLLLETVNSVLKEYS